MIAYFSYTGNTAAVAETIKEITGGELFQIKTVNAYPSPNKRDEMAKLTTKEMNDNARPELSTHVENMKDYDAFYLVYPIWWGSSPMAVFTFLEEYDFPGKTIIPFCTHEGSGLGSTPRAIASTCHDATVLDGIAISSESVNSSQD